MTIPVLDKLVYKRLESLVKQLEEHLKADCFLYFGEINPMYKDHFMQEFESLSSCEGRRDNLVFLLQTPGGVAEMAEKMVEIMRHHYTDIKFIVPDYAMSAGTILCMAGDDIMMNYGSSLGPIDPQIYNGDKLVPAQGYLDQFEKIREKSEDGTITAMELQLVRDLDLADLNLYEQAKGLTVTLLKKWLVQYKFKNWTEHKTDPIKKGQPVTAEEKADRAEEIAEKLGNNAYWHSHGRFIGLQTLRDDLRLEISDYTEDQSLDQKITEYYRLAVDCFNRQGFRVFTHHRGLLHQG